MFLGPALDSEYETDVQTSAPKPALHETAYVTLFKPQYRSGPSALMVAFSNNRQPAVGCHWKCSCMYQSDTSDIIA